MLIGTDMLYRLQPAHSRVPVEFHAFALSQPLRGHTIMGNFTAWLFEPVSYKPPPFPSPSFKQGGNSGGGGGGLPGNAVDQQPCMVGVVGWGIEGCESGEALLTR